MRTAAPAFVLAMLLPGCANAKEIRQSDLDAISDKCQLQRSTMQLEAKDTVRFQPPADAKFAAVDCVLNELKKAKFPNMKMGFVGNEISEPEAK